MPEATLKYTRDEVAELVRRHAQDYLGQPVMASGMDYHPDGSWRVSYTPNTRFAEDDE